MCYHDSDIVPGTRAQNLCTTTDYTFIVMFLPVNCKEIAAGKLDVTAEMVQATPNQDSLQ